MKIVANHIADIGKPGEYKLLNTTTKTVSKELRKCANSTNPMKNLNKGQTRTVSKIPMLLKKIMILFKSADGKPSESRTNNASENLHKQLYADILDPKTKRVLNSANSTIRQANTFVKLPSPETARVLGFESSGFAKEKISTALNANIENLKELLETTNDRLAVQLTMTTAITARTNLQNLDLDATPDITDLR